MAIYMSKENLKQKMMLVNIFSVVLNKSLTIIDGFRGVYESRKTDIKT